MRRFAHRVPGAACLAGSPQGSPIHLDGRKRYGAGTQSMYFRDGSKSSRYVSMVDQIWIRTPRSMVEWPTPAGSKDSTSPSFARTRSINSRVSCRKSSFAPGSTAGACPRLRRTGRDSSRRELSLRSPRFRFSARPGPFQRRPADPRYYPTPALMSCSPAYRRNCTPKNSVKRFQAVTPIRCPVPSISRWVRYSSSRFSKTAPACHSILGSARPYLRFSSSPSEIDLARATLQPLSTQELTDSPRTDEANGVTWR